MLMADFPLRMLCRLFVVNRNSIYRANAANVEVPMLGKESEEKAKLIELAARWPRYGYRRLTIEMRRAGYPVNAKKTRRLMSELGIQGHVPKRKARTTQRNPCLAGYPNLVLKLEVSYPEQVWVADVTYIALREEFVYLAIIMDVFTRQIRGWHLSRSLEQTLTLNALSKALLHHQPPKIHHSDQGVQYTSQVYVQTLNQNNVQISNSEVGQAWQNGFAERLMRTIKEEEVDLQDYQNFDDALQNIKTFIEEVYGKKRIHSSLGYLTPAEFEAHWQKHQEVTIIDPSVVSI
jgi:transposase InsO family protein